MKIIKNDIYWKGQETTQTNSTYDDGEEIFSINVFVNSLVITKCRTFFQRVLLKINKVSLKKSKVHFASCAKISWANSYCQRGTAWLKWVWCGKVLPLKTIKMAATKDNKLLIRIKQKRNKMKELNALTTYLVLWRRKSRNLMFLLLENENQLQQNHRSHSTCWMQHSRNQIWFTNVWKIYSDKIFKSILRMSVQTFTHILQLIRDDLERDYLHEMEPQ